MLKATLGASLSENMWAGKAKIPGWGIKTADKRTIKAGQGFHCHLII